MSKQHSVAKIKNNQTQHLFEATAISPSMAKTSLKITGAAFFVSISLLFREGLDTIIKFYFFVSFALLIYSLCLPYTKLIHRKFVLTHDTIFVGRRNVPEDLIVHVISEGKGRKFNIYFETIKYPFIIKVTEEDQVRSWEFLKSWCEHRDIPFKQHYYNHFE